MRMCLFCILVIWSSVGDGDFLSLFLFWCLGKVD